MDKLHELYFEKFKISYIQQESIFKKRLWWTVQFDNFQHDAGLDFLKNNLNKPIEYMCMYLTNRTKRAIIHKKEQLRKESENVSS